MRSAAVKQRDADRQWRMKGQHTSHHTSHHRIHIFYPLPSPHTLPCPSKSDGAAEYLWRRQFQVSHLDIRYPYSGRQAGPSPAIARGAPCRTPQGLGSRQALRNVRAPDRHGSISRSSKPQHSTASCSRVRAAASLAGWRLPLYIAWMPECVCLPVRCGMPRAEGREVYG